MQAKALCMVQEIVSGAVMRALPAEPPITLASYRSIVDIRFWWSAGACGWVDKVLEPRSTFLVIWFLSACYVQKVFGKLLILCCLWTDMQHGGMMKINVTVAQAACIHVWHVLPTLVMLQISTDPTYAGWDKSCISAGRITSRIQKYYNKLGWKVYMPCWCDHSLGGLDM